MKKSAKKTMDELLFGPLDSCATNMHDTLAENSESRTWGPESMAKAHYDTFEECFRIEHGRFPTDAEMVKARAALLSSAEFAYCSIPS